MMQPWLKVAGAFALVFVAGAAADRAIARTTRVVAPASWPDVARALELSAEQRAATDAIFARYQPRTDALLADLAPRLKALTDSMHAAIESVLTPAQRARLTSVLPASTFVIKRKTDAGVRVDTLNPR